LIFLNPKASLGLIALVAERTTTALVAWPALGWAGPPSMRR
jgi:hypothetical protein